MLLHIEEWCEERFQPSLALDEADEKHSGKECVIYRVLKYENERIVEIDRGDSEENDRETGDEWEEGDTALPHECHKKCERRGGGEYSGR